MKKKIIHTFLTFMLIFVATTGFAQEKKVLGKVISKTRDLQGIHIKNINTDQSVLTEKGGYFSIEARPNDTLIFTAVHLVGREKVLTYADMNKSLVFIPMEYYENVMDELVIYRQVTTESLGLGGARKYTPAERRLHTATSSGGGIIPVDALVNAISGRTKMLKKALELERENMLVQEVLNRFSEEYYIDRLNIPLQYHQAFGYFMAQDPLVLASYKNTEITELSFMYAEKATEFLEILNVLK
ncbi:MAG TPA: hypothetical protein VKY33_09340 [Flavobacterium sp.]|nr:hypothetical protein [Flavobacterium sp.]